MTLSKEAKNEGGGQDIPCASSGMGGVSMETSCRPCPDDYRGSQSPLCPPPASLRQAWLAVSAEGSQAKPHPSHRGLGEAGQDD